MPAIWNVSQNYSNNNKKLTSKLTFAAGETFKGRIAEKADGNEIKVKLADGWQFSAEVEGDTTFTEQDVVKFEVIGYENGKLKLKLLEGSEEGIDSKKDSLQTLVKKEGLEETDVDILKSMVEHDIPLTRDNIKFVKSIIQFNIRVNNNPEEVDNFINKFLESKNIDSNSEEAAQIRQVLTEFINEFKGMSSKDILLFLENNISMTKANIDSYNKLFNGEINLKDYFQGLSEELNNMDLSNLSKGHSQVTTPSNIVENLVQNNETVSTSNTNLFATKVYDSVESAGAKVNVLDILKSMVNSELEDVKSELNNIISNRISDFSVSEYSEVTLKIKSLGDKELLDLINNALNKEGKLDKEGINKIINSLLGKEIQISNDESEKLIESFKPLMDNKLSEISNKANADVALKEEIINLFQNKDNTSLGENLNTISNEKLIALIKDSVKNSGDLTKEGLDKIFSQLLNKDVKLSNEDFNSLKEMLSTRQQANLTSNLMGREGIKEDLKNGILGIKESVKDIIKVIENTGLDNSKVVEFLKENINDFKLFNSINKEYYYLDVPINQQGKEYQCKLVIKDKRKDGKKIDKTNVKVVVSINTINLGKIDNYLTIRGNNINVDIKCEEDMVKVLDKNKDVLVKSLSEIGLLANISVSKKVEEVSLTTCREFFNESKLSIIDRTV